MKQRKTYSKEFKEGAVRLVTDQGRSISDAASSLGIPYWSLSRWVSSARKEGKDAFGGNGNRSPHQQEVFELQQRLKRLEEENQILKKAAAYFASHLR